MTDVNQEDGVQAEVTRDADGFIVGNDTLTFTVPKDTVKEGAVAGAEIEKPFSYRQVDSDDLAQRIITEKKWDLQELVNRKLKADARSTAYQSELLQHKPVTTTRTPDEIKESMVRDALRLGMSESDARNYVDSMLASIKK
jgi:hypothetical protein